MQTFVSNFFHASKAESNKNDRRRGVTPALYFTIEKFMSNTLKLKVILKTPFLAFHIFLLQKHSCGIKRIMRKGYDSMIVMDIYSFKEFCIPYFYTCSFRIDSTVPYQTLNFETIKKDLRFLLTKFKRPLVAWHDPNFGIRFEENMDAIASVAPPKSFRFIAESSLSILTEEHLKEMQQWIWSDVAGH